MFYLKKIYVYNENTDNIKNDDDKNFSYINDKKNINDLIFLSKPRIVSEPQRIQLTTNDNNSIDKISKVANSYK